MIILLSTRGIIDTDRSERQNEKPALKTRANGSELEQNDYFLYNPCF
jgi:hypothetical protein